MIRGVRGATTIEIDQPELIFSETTKLVNQIVEENNIQIDDIVSVILSTTPDITSAFPAKAVRSLEGWQFVPTMCTHEMNVPGALPHCIRVLMHVNTDLSQENICHVYLNDAEKLRPDLVK